jgi:iron complex outermembrane receptor protein
VTRSKAGAAFLVEERVFGNLRVNAGLRLENVKRKPVTRADRSFGLTSYSIGGMWTLAPGHGGAVLGRPARSD